MFCFYHSDLDGMCAGAIVKMRYPACEMHPINYGYDFPWDIIKADPDPVVIMVDFCLEPFEQMEQLNTISTLYWIDHHKSAIAHANEYQFCPNGGISTRIGLAGCELTWDYLYATEPPRSVYLVGRYDVWDHSDPHALILQYYLKSWDMDPRSTNALIHWFSLFQNGPELDRAIHEGLIIKRYVEQFNAIYAKGCFETELEGLRCIAVNRLFTNSKIFDTVYDSTLHDCMLTFGWRNNQWTVSLYTDKPDIDVSIIAVKYGGGGHKGAAGFQCGCLPFELK